MSTFSKFILTILFAGSTLTCIASENKPINQKPKFERNAGFWSNPKDETNKTFFNKLTDIKSQRENWYKVSPYIAEFWCAISNAGFLYVGAKHKSYELLFAGLASLTSHSIPKQWLLYADKAGVALTLLKLAKEYDVILANPKLSLGLLAALAILNATDAYLARNKAKTLPHVVWHLSAAFIADQFLNLKK